MELTFDLPMNIDKLDTKKQIRYLWDQLYLLNEKLNLLTTNTTNVTLVQLATGGVGGSTSGGTIDPDSGDIVVYDGATVITPVAFDDQTLSTANRMLLEDIQVLQIPYHSTSNQDGTTINIG